MRSIFSLGLLTLGLTANSVLAQSVNSVGAPEATSVGGNGSSNSGRIVRDPVTGRVFYQQWITETVPATRWENKQITTTVYDTQWVNQVVPTTQSVMQPQTQYVLQPVWKGAWNPFRQPTLTYQSKPVTTWVPTNVTTNQVVPRQQVTPRQQTITIPQPVTENRTQQRLVQTEIHQPSAYGTGFNPPNNQLAGSQTPTLFNVPLLARRPFSTTPQYGSYSNNTKLSQTIFPQNYSAPLRTASGQGGAWNPMQSGMTPTVLR